jgi:hypothetical protein
MVNILKNTSRNAGVFDCEEIDYHDTIRWDLIIELRVLS